MSLAGAGPLVAAAALLALAALLGCMEAALGRVSRVRVAELLREEVSGARALAAVLEESRQTVNLLLLLRTVCSISATALVTGHVLSVTDGALPVVGAVAVVVVVDYVVVGVSLRTIGRQQAERVALLGAVPALLLRRVVGPLPALLILVGNAVTPGKGLRDGPFASEAELRDLVDLAQERGVVEESEADMINSVFELGDTLVREVMVPRTDVVTIERGKTVKQALTLLLRSGFSRVPVIGDNADEVLGVAYLKDLVRKERVEGGERVKVEDVMRQAVFVPESKKVDELLREMQARLGHIAIVVDEYGGTAGLVTLEDIVEEVVGEITDEYDREAPPVEEVDGETRRVTARLPVEDLEELYAVELPHEDVETVGGLLASLLGRVPIPGAEATVAGLRLVAERADGRRNRIGTVLVSRVETAPGRDQEHAAR